MTILGAGIFYRVFLHIKTGEPSCVYWISINLAVRWYLRWTLAAANEVVVLLETNKPGYWYTPSTVINSLAPGRYGCNLKSVTFTPISRIDILEHFLRNGSLNAKRPYWRLVTIGSGNGLVLSGNKPSPEPMSTQFCVAIWSLGHNELTFLRHWDKMSKIMLKIFFKCISLHENCHILLEISLKFVCSGPVSDNPGFVQILL